MNVLFVPNVLEVLHILPPRDDTGYHVGEDGALNHKIVSNTSDSSNIINISLTNTFEHIKMSFWVFYNMFLHNGHYTGAHEILQQAVHFA